MRTHWTEQDVPDQTGRVAVLTGATGGIGFAVARGLALAGATLVLGVRDLGLGAAAAEVIRAAAPLAQVSVVYLDLASLSAVRSFAARVRGEHDGLDLLVDCAAIMAVRHGVSADGFELQLATNHLGHFALTGLLIDRLLARPGGRVVSVSSINHRTGRIRFDDLQSRRKYGAWSAYGQSKLANLLFAFELDRRLRAAGAPVESVAAHPGYSRPGLQAGIGKPAVRRFFLAANRVFAQAAGQGALPVLYAATAAGVPGGAYVGPDGLFELRGGPGRAQAAGTARDQALAERLWSVSEELTGVTFPPFGGRLVPPSG